MSAKDQKLQAILLRAAEELGFACFWVRRATEDRKEKDLLIMLRKLEELACEAQDIVLTKEEVAQ